MGFEFLRGQTNTIMLTVLRLSNSEPSFPADYSTPEVRISHINGGSEIEDLALTVMTQVPGSNRWYLKFPIPTIAPFTKYLVTFESTLDTVDTVATEEYKVVAAPGDIGGGGEFPVTLQFKHETTAVGIPNVEVKIYDKSNPTVPIAQGTTDDNGEVTFFLDAGFYTVSSKKTGSVSETHDLEVKSDGTFCVTGD